jgi:hypothetical protein
MFRRTHRNAVLQMRLIDENHHEARERDEVEEEKEPRGTDRVGRHLVQVGLLDANPDEIKHNAKLRNERASRLIQWTLTKKRPMRTERTIGNATFLSISFRIWDDATVTNRLTAKNVLY